MCKKIGEKLNKEDYRPEIMYITVNKRVTSRFYSLGGGKHPQGKFMPKVNNPDPGSIILDEMSIDDKYDFHLAAQQVTQGTCTPTHYVVAYDNSRLPQDALTQFTNEQCYNYYNWAGAVKVPACLQSASKLAKIVGESILSEVEGPLQKTFFFL